MASSQQQKQPDPPSRQELRLLARSRLKDAECLFENKRYDGAVYLCGYVVELALKARICRTLKWTHFAPPAAAKQGFQIHNFDALLTLSGVEEKIKVSYTNPWSAVGTWDPSLRYRPVGNATPEQARELLDAAAELLKALQ